MERMPGEGRSRQDNVAGHETVLLKDILLLAEPRPRELPAVGNWSRPVPILLVRVAALHAAEWFSTSAQTQRKCYCPHSRDYQS